VRLCRLARQRGARADVFHPRRRCVELWSRPRHIDDTTAYIAPKLKRAQRRM
jgi:hypothetical protein